MKQMNREVVTNKMNRRLKMNTLAKWIFFGITLLILCILVILLVRIFSQGMAYFDWHFLTNFASRRAENAGILGPLVGSLMLMVVVIPIALILGIGTAIYLEEYAKKNWFTPFLLKPIFKIWLESLQLFSVF